MISSTSCTRCGGQLKIIASIEEPQLIAKIMSHLERAAPEHLTLMRWAVTLVIAYAAIAMLNSARAAEPD